MEITLLHSLVSLVVGTSFCVFGRKEVFRSLLLLFFECTTDSMGGEKRERENKFLFHLFQHNQSRLRRSSSSECSFWFFLIASYANNFVMEKIFISCYANRLFCDRRERFQSHSPAWFNCQLD